MLTIKFIDPSHKKAKIAFEIWFQSIAWNLGVDGKEGRKKVSNFQSLTMSKCLKCLFIRALCLSFVKLSMNV